MHMRIVVLGIMLVVFRMVAVLFPIRHHAGDFHGANLTWNCNVEKVVAWCTVYDPLQSKQGGCNRDAPRKQVGLRHGKMADGRWREDL